MMEFRTFVNFLVHDARQVVRTGRRLVVRLLAWNEWQSVFLRLVAGCNGRSAADAGLPGVAMTDTPCRAFKTGIRKSPSAAALNPERKPVTVANHRVIRRSAIVMVVRSRSAPRDAAPATANVNQPTLV